MCRPHPATGPVVEGDVLLEAEVVAPLEQLQNHGLTLVQVKQLCELRGLAASLFTVDDGN
eukprot:CAMPEP_0114142960 /NCGR_PEP_ID=MMETSP0043_2-20121206/18727_1 /TAXON_ID=464988 /ORGANISM="Hemiselmis andersenii, Strain CCMP644" /LENGTH=59 /DNA_ID=CAMNT_0001237217 /DNA_START=51 /DNA_END=227 /DNA_ORIENTATION=-